MGEGAHPERIPAFGNSRAGFGERSMGVREVGVHGAGDKAAGRRAAQQAPAVLFGEHCVGIRQVGDEGRGADEGGVEQSAGDAGGQGFVLIISNSNRR